MAAGVSADGTSDYKVFSRYEDENFKTMVAMLRKWYNEGLIDRDAQNYEGEAKIWTAPFSALPSRVLILHWS